jgi:RNA polymerase sigma factor for flagellar operon FliA
MPDKHTSPIFSASDLHQRLWSEFQRTGDPVLRRQIASLYLDLVHSVASQVACGLPPCVDVNDLVQEGYMGLHRAIGTFDLSYGVKFTTYACSAIRGAMLDSLRRAAWAPRGARQRAGEIERARHEMMSRLERPPTDEELARCMGVNSTEYERIATDAHVVSQVSLWRDTSDRLPRGQTAKELLPPDRRVEDPCLEAQRRDLRELLLRGFDTAERLIVILYYFERMTMKEIGATLGMSESRVSQMHALVVERIKATLADRMREFE